MRRKSLWAVIAGVLVVLVATTLVDIVLHLVHVYPPSGEPPTRIMVIQNLPALVERLKGGAR